MFYGDLRPVLTLEQFCLSQNGSIIISHTLGSIKVYLILSYTLEPLCGLSGGVVFKKAPVCIQTVFTKQNSSNVRSGLIWCILL